MRVRQGSRYHPGSREKSDPTCDTIRDVKCEVMDVARTAFHRVEHRRLRVW